MNPESPALRAAADRGEIDLEQLRSLVALRDPTNPRFAEELIALSLEELPRRLLSLRACLEPERRLPELARLAHGLAGSAASLGALAVERLARSLEAAAAAGDIAEAKRLVDALDAELPRFCALLRSE